MENQHNTNLDFILRKPFTFSDIFSQFCIKFLISSSTWCFLIVNHIHSLYSSKKHSLLCLTYQICLNCFLHGFSEIWSIWMNLLLLKTFICFYLTSFRFLFQNVWSFINIFTLFFILDYLVNDLKCCLINLNDKRIK